VVLKGEKQLHTKNGDIIVRAGEAFFLAKGEYVMSEKVEGDEYACLLIFFDDRVAGDMFAAMPPCETTDAAKNDGFFRVELTSCFKAAADSMLLLTEQKPKFADELLLLKLKELMLLLLGSAQGAEFASYFKASMCGEIDLRLFMNEHFTQSWNLEEFAKRSGRSLSAFKGEFAKLFGATPMEWLWQKRLERAKLFIEKGGLDIGEAAHKCGFKSHSHFTRMFKASFGHAPKKTSQAKN
ncbi:MAG TPA: AraC family transcriptional regulator, partial [Campylobacterales bacterium]|nr:AraC family transcriptional regulator [Campylobacterales bacterium]